MEMDILLRAKEVARFLGVSERTIWNWASDSQRLANGFPKPIKLGIRRVGFSKKQLEEYQNFLKGNK